MIEKKNKERVEIAKKKQKEERMNSQAKLEVAKRGLILERDSIVRQQKLKAIFSGDAEDARYSTPSLARLEPTSVLAQQVSLPKRSGSVALIKYSGA